MKVLWITNVVFPEAMIMLKGDGTFKTTGGWMLASAEYLIGLGCELVVATVSRDVDTLVHMKGKSIVYYLIPYGRGNLRENPLYEPYWNKINENEKPDIVHIHGSEFSHGLSYVRVTGSNNVIVSIQGLVSEYIKYYFDGMTRSDIIRCCSIRDVLKNDTLWHNYYDMRLRAQSELKLLGLVKHIIGRTEWDRLCSSIINPKATYHFCNETLRPSFYSGCWSHHGNNRIFVSQASYPIKGMHQLIKAIALMDNKPYVRVAGYNLVDQSSVRKKLTIKSYGKYLSFLIKRYGLQDYISFTGPLSEDEMKCELLNCDAFISPSSIENSSNAICEAQLMGVPVIASKRGGTPTIIEDGLTGRLYDFYDIQCLSTVLAETLKSDCAEMSLSERKVARLRHDPKTNAYNLINIYQSVINDPTVV